MQGFTTLERYEYKYWVPPRLMPLVRAHVESFMVPEHGGAAQRNVSLYLDSIDRQLYRAHLWGSADRFKLRVRRYGAGPSEQVFAEIKRKVKDVVVKKRAVIAAADWTRVIEPTGPIADPQLNEFAYLLAVTGARPQTVVSCDRTAWVPRTSLESTRVTIDEAIVAYPWRGAFFDLDGRHSTPIDGEDEHAGEGRQAILELKFTGAAPGWMQGLVQRFGLYRTAYSKFCAAMRAVDPAAHHWLITHSALARAERDVYPNERGAFSH
jgi:VTC domain